MDDGFSQDDVPLNYDDDVVDFKSPPAKDEYLKVKQEEDNNPYLLQSDMG